MNAKDTRKELMEIGLDTDEIKEVLQNIHVNNEDDFEAGDHRFIHTDKIDSIMVDELSSDTYMLGSFTDWFVADITGLDFGIVKRAQDAENFELLGELMLQKINDVQVEYVKADGYGHHFGHYDGNEIELGEYHAFRIN